MSKQKFAECVDCSAKKSKPTKNPRCKKCATKKAWEQDKTRRLKMGSDAKERWKDSDFRERASFAAGNLLKERWKDESYRLSQVERVSRQSRERWESEEYRSRIAEIHKKQWQDEEYRRKVIQNRAVSHRETKSNPDWRVNHSIRMGGDGDIERLNARREGKPWLRKESRWWSSIVKKRDRMKCRHCGTAEKLHAHHIKPKGKHPEAQFDLDNGITLCESCHRAEHRKMNDSCAHNFCI